MSTTITTTTNVTTVDGTPIRIGIFTYNEAGHNFCSNLVDSSRAAAAAKHAGTCIPPRFVKQVINQMMDIKTRTLPDIIVVALQEGNGTGRDGLLAAFDDYLTSLPWTATANPRDALQAATRQAASATASWVSRASLLSTGLNEQQLVVAGADLFTKPVMGTRFQFAPGFEVRQLSMRIWMRAEIDRQYVIVARQALVPSLTRAYGIALTKETQIIMLLLSPRLGSAMAAAATSGIATTTTAPLATVMSETVGGITETKVTTTQVAAVVATPPPQPQVQFITLFHSHLPMTERNIAGKITTFDEWIKSGDPVLHRRGITLRDIMPEGKDKGVHHLGLTNRLLDMQNVWAQFNTEGTGIRAQFLNDAANALKQLPSAVFPTAGTRISVSMFWFGDLNFRSQPPAVINVKEYVDSFGRKTTDIDHDLESAVVATPTASSTTTTTTIVTEQQLPLLQAGRTYLPGSQAPGVVAPLFPPVLTPPISFGVVSTPTPETFSTTIYNAGSPLGTPTPSTASSAAAVASLRAVSDSFEAPLTHKLLLQEIKYSRPDARLQFDQLDRIRRFDDCMTRQFPGQYAACIGEVGGELHGDEPGDLIGLPPFVEGQFPGDAITFGSSPTTFAEIKFAPTCKMHSIYKTLKGISNKKHAEADHQLEAICAADPYDVRCFDPKRFPSYCDRQLQWAEQLVSIRTVEYDAVKLQPQSGMQASDHVGVVGVYDIVPQLVLV